MATTAPSALNPTGIILAGSRQRALVAPGASRALELGDVVVLDAFNEATTDESGLATCICFAYALKAARPRATTAAKAAEPPQAAAEPPAAPGAAPGAAPDAAPEAPAAAPAPPADAGEAPLFSLKQLVEVAPRTHPGFNYHGGTAMIAKIHDERSADLGPMKDGSASRTTGFTYGVKYVLGGRGALQGLSLIHI